MIKFKSNASLLGIVFIACLICCFERIGAREKTTPILTHEAEREKLLNLLSGEWVSRGIYVATKLEVAEALQHGPKSIEELAQVTSSNPDSLYRLLHMLAGFGLFQEVSPNVFANTETSRLLIKTHPDTLFALSLFYGEEIHKSMDELLPSIQSGTTAFQLEYKQPVFSYLKDNPSRLALFQEGMKEKSQAVIKSVLATYDFSPFESVYDIGGGYGHFLLALLKKYPNVSGVLYELLEVIEKINHQNPQLEDYRFKLCAGDFFVSVPPGGDVYLMKSVIHDWDDEKSEMILKNCYQAMSSDSRLLLVEVVLLPEDQSLYANCMDILMLAIPGGKERSLATFTRMLDKCGFVLERIYPTATEFSILEARKK